jgi:hypothetical protein
MYYQQRAEMMYQVKLGPHASYVVDLQGRRVADGHVLRVTFPFQQLATPQGMTHVINGAPEADIIVGGQVFFGVDVV